MLFNENIYNYVGNWIQGNKGDLDILEYKNWQYN